ncbi:flagellar biosynthesis anti-sigma factor FlgM [Variovorax sp. HJSM1_2]|uniref:flagellar biosynthesis anti-sigma factor FlgM n=1 Tax=Variovorax sp. HJSM1_2 TaxID=3366263 RepID=UPI003BC8D788
MKIGQTPELPALAGVPDNKKVVQEKEAAPAGVAREGVRATTSGASVSVSTMVRSLEQSSKGVTADFDEKKVAELRAAIANGTFKVDAEAIADKLLANASEMLSVNRNY